MSTQFSVPTQRPIENFVVTYLIRRHNLKPEIVETIIALAHINIEGRA